MAKKKKKFISKHTYYIKKDNTWIGWIVYQEGAKVKVLPEHLSWVLPFVTKEIPNILSLYKKW